MIDLHQFEFQIDVNRKFTDKVTRDDPRYFDLNMGFVTETVTVSQLIQAIHCGHSWTAPLRKIRHPKSGGGLTTFRVKANVIEVTALALDIDTGDERATFDALRADEFIAAHATFLHSTASSTPEHPRTRVVFVLRQAVDVIDAELAMLALLERYPFADQGCKDAGRIFYGARDCALAHIGNLFEPDAFEAVVADQRRKRDDAIAERERRRQATQARLRLEPVNDDQVSVYVAAAVRSLADDIATTPEGAPGETRHSKLVSAATRVGHLLASPWVQESPAAVAELAAAEELLFEAATVNGYVAKYGSNGTGANVLKTIQNAVQYGYSSGPADVPEFKTWNEPGSIVAGANGAAPAMDGDDPLAHLGLYKLADVIDDELPEIEWVVDGLVARGQLTYIVGPPKAGKSFMLLQLAQAVDLGLSFLGRTVTRSNVMYFALEDPEKRVRRRSKAMRYRPRTATFAHKLDPLDNGRGGPAAGTTQIRAAAERFDVVIVDTMIAAMSGMTNENDNSMMGRIVNELANVAHDSGCGIVVVHHTTKNQTYDDPFNMIRGGGAIRGAYDIGAVMLKRPGEPEAQLHVEGRDIEYESYTLRQARGGMGWDLLGGGYIIGQIRAGRKIVKHMEGAGDGLTAEELASAIGTSRQNIHAQLLRLEKDGHVERKTDPVEDDGKPGRPSERWYLR